MLYQFKGYILVIFYLVMVPFFQFMWSQKPLYSVINLGVYEIKFGLRLAIIQLILGMYLCIAMLYQFKGYILVIFYLVMVPFFQFMWSQKPLYSVINLGVYEIKFGLRLAII